MIKFETVEDAATNAQTFLASKALELRNRPLPQFCFAVETIGFAWVTVFFHNSFWNMHIR